MVDAFFALDIEKQIQQLQAQRSNLPKVDIGEKVSVILNAFCPFLPSMSISTLFYTKLHIPLIWLMHLLF